MALDQSALLEVLDALKVADVGDRVRQVAETIYQALIEAELTEAIGAAPHERCAERVNQRNGHRARTLSTRAGDLELRIPSWENARRRDDANDFVTFALAGPATVTLAELDTSHFVGNAPGWVALRGIDARSASLEESRAWSEVLPRTRLQPDTPHRFRLGAHRPMTHIRMDVFPDGGLARVRLYGSMDPAQRRVIGLRWFNALPETHARTVLAQHADGEHAAKLAASRPFTDAAALPDALLTVLE